MSEKTQAFRLPTVTALALCLAAATGTVQAQPAERFLGGGAQGNVVGGGVATIMGGDDNMSILYSGGGAGAGRSDPAQAGRLARLGGGTGNGPEVEYLEPAPSRGGRAAWLIGGGDNAEVVYRNRH